MFRTTKFCVLPISAVLLLAAGDASWRIKPISQWNEEDARQVLADSPWIKRATAAIVPDRGEAQRREGGKMGGYQGVGLDRSPDSWRLCPLHGFHEGELLLRRTRLAAEFF